jgi:ABC-type nitrate/sulfonate/bicarbonate transport system substrate-binding protein
MEKLIITGVPEHFNFPWVKVVDSQPFLADGIELVWQNEPKGSGAMNKALRDKSTDLAIVLTESFIKDKIEGNPGLIVGLHVRSPLIWGIHAPGGIGTDDLAAFAGAPFLVSRMGSGSHLMAFLLAKREGWDRDNLQFEIIGDLNGAIESMKAGVPKLFLWEKFTTKPLVDSGVFERVGEIPTPWPCFAIVARENSIRKFGSIIGELRDMVYRKSIQLRKEENLAEQISAAYGIQVDDVKNWLNQTEWAENNVVSKSDIENTQQILIELGLINKKSTAEMFISPSLATLVDG